MKQVLTFKYRFMLLIAGFGMLISSCQKEELQSNSQKQDLLNSSQKNEVRKCVPFKAKFETSERDISPTEAQITGTGTGTHIGKSTFVATVNAADFPLLTGTQTITAANGDLIYSTFSGSAAGPDENGTLLITNNNTITGGTGRFKDATGSFIANVIQTSSPKGTVTFEGTICY